MIIIVPIILHYNFIMKKKANQHISGWSFYKNQQHDKTLFGRLKRTESQALPKNKRLPQLKQQIAEKSIIDIIKIQQKKQEPKQIVDQILIQKKAKPQSPKKSAITILDQKKYILKNQPQKEKSSNYRGFSPKKQKTKRQHLQLQGYCPILDISNYINIKKKQLNQYYDILFLLQVVSQKLRVQTFDGKFKNHQQKMECLFPILFGPMHNESIFSPYSKQRILYLNGNKCLPQKNEHSASKSLKNNQIWKQK